jgi:hypothetical protein
MTSNDFCNSFLVVDWAAPFLNFIFEPYLNRYSFAWWFLQRLSTTMKTVAKGILKDHLVLVANSMTCTGNLNGFNNAGYKATFRSLKVQVPFTESTLFVSLFLRSFDFEFITTCTMLMSWSSFVDPYEMLWEGCREMSFWFIGLCGLIMFVGQACSTWHWVIFWDSLERKSGKLVFQSTWAYCSYNWWSLSLIFM